MQSSGNPTMELKQPSNTQDVSDQPQPYALRIFLFFGSLLGQVPLTLTSIFNGRPRFHLVSFGSLMAALNLTLATYNLHHVCEEFISDVKASCGQPADADFSSDNSSSTATPAVNDTEDLTAVFSKGIAFAAAGMNYFVNILYTFILVVARRKTVASGSFALRAFIEVRGAELSGLGFLLMFLGLGTVRAAGHVMLVSRIQLQQWVRRQIWTM
jgi:hypothetical protein